MLAFTVFKSQMMEPDILWKKKFFGGEIYCNFLKEMSKNIVFKLIKVNLSDLKQFLNEFQIIFSNS